MLDHFSIFTRGGLVLFTFQLSALKGSPLDALIQTCLLQERSGETSFRYGQGASAYTLKWSFHNELGLVFVAVYHSLLQLLYVEELLEMVKTSFAKTFSPQKCTYQEEFGGTFQELLRMAEERAEEMKRPKHITSFEQTKKGQQVQQYQQQPKKEKKAPGGGAGGAPASGAKQRGEEEGDGGDEADGEGGNGSGDSVTQDGASGAREPAFDLSKLRGPRKKAGAGGKPQGGPARGPSPAKGGPAAAAAGKEEDAGKKPKKALRKWDDGEPPESKDFSDPKGRDAPVEVVDVATVGKSLMDEEEPPEEDEDEEEEEDEEEGGGGGPLKAKGQLANGSGAGKGNGHAAPKRASWLSSIFRNVTGKSALEAEDLESALKALRERLMSKNVAEEIAAKLCDSVEASLIGRKHASFTRISSTVHAAMEEALQRILTPKRSVDILRDVFAARDAGRPYVIVFVGVNGVGKSTNLAKVAFWLLQHDVKVMLAACDTFRAGAVEQLRTHARRLQVPLFEKGYEKDPASVAKDAIREAVRTRQDVVLVDTAGRMQDNEPLMRALSKLINQNTPDLVLFVGEALVGNDAVDQLTKFNQRLADLSPTPEARAIDGILLTKFDTIDDKVGAALSMVYTSGAPVMFVGCGQTYTDLKKLNVKQIIKALLK